MVYSACSSENAVCCRTEQTGFAAEDHSGGVYGILEKLIIDGGTRLCGEVKLQGAKNSVLPILAASILCDDECYIDNCPRLSDCNVSMRIIRHLGKSAYRDGGSVIIGNEEITKNDIPEDMMREMRSSITFLGAIIAKMGEAKISLPGGCELGPRPIDIHISALRQMGVDISENHGLIECKVRDKLRGAMIALPYPSVGATENIILAAVLAKGTTIISNAAKEPEIVDLTIFLRSCGAKIIGAGESTVIICGVESLSGAYHKVIPDRIEAISYMSAIAITGGTGEVIGVVPEHIMAVIPIFEESGCKLQSTDSGLSITAPERLGAVKYIRTMPYPAFPTDAQAIIMALMAQSMGTSVFVETVFSGRYKHIAELQRMGANIKAEDRVAVVSGIERLSGASVSATDLRGGAALVIAALGADGRSEISNIHYIDRGYENIEGKLKKLGACITRVDS